MEVILLERIARLGQLGDTVRVRDGYARNFLLPTGRALRNSEANRARFETQKAQLIARNEERRTDAQAIGSQLEGKRFVIIRSAGETGQLYGSVSARDLAEIIKGEGYNISRNSVNLNLPLKTIGLHTVSIILHAEVEIQVEVNIARSPDEAERQARGELLTSADAIYGTDEDENEVEEDAEDADSEEASDEEAAS